MGNGIASKALATSWLMSQDNFVAAGLVCSRRVEVRRSWGLAVLVRAAAIAETLPFYRCLAGEFHVGGPMLRVTYQGQFANGQFRATSRR